MDVTLLRRVALVVFAGMAASGVGAQNDVRDYLQAKARFDSLYAKRYDSLSRQNVAIALKDLESRMRRILGPDSLPGFSQSFNLTWLPSGDPGGWVLDGMALSNPRAQMRGLVTTRGLVDAWLRQIHQWTPDPLVGLATEDALTWVLDENAHVYLFADLREKAAPQNVFLAALIDQTNGDPMSPSEILVGVDTGERIYLLFGPAVAHIDLTAQCGKAWETTYQPCFRRTVATHPDFPKLVGQARDLARLVSARPHSPSAQRSFMSAALAPTVLRSEVAAPQLRPRPGANIPLRIACMAVFVVGLIWIAKLALD